MIIKSKAGTEISKNGYTVIDELNEIPLIKTNYLQLEHNHINPILLMSKAFEYKDAFVNVVEDTKTSGDTAFKEYNAIHEFAWILSGMRKHDSYTGYLSLEQFLTMTLKDTGFTYQVEGGHQYYAQHFENLGDGESHLDMFFKMLNRWNTEFELRGRKVFITHQRGRLRDKHVGRYKMNIIDTIINSDITDGATAVWGYFGKVDEENPKNSTYREFYWQIDELVEQYGIRYAKPYSNENITQEETMIEYLNDILLDSWKISTEVDVAEITDEVAQTGDEYVAVDERLGIKLSTRIQKLESIYDADDTLLYQTATLGTVSFASSASGSSNQLQEVIEKVKKDYNDRITDLKQEFDNRFNDEVTQIEIDFNDLISRMRDEIEADYDAMSNDFEQMKHDQQERVNEIHEDIDTVNQTVNDVVQQANYLDGVYTDLSQQTVQVSSTVADIIDGKAPNGSVLKQTMDGVLNRVWEQDINKIADTTNLIARSDIGIRQSVTDFKDYRNNGRIQVSVESTATGGLYIDASKLEPNTDYIISYKYRKLTGNLIVFGGHVDAAFRNKVKVTIDGVEVTGYDSENATPVSNDMQTHEVIYTFTTPSSINVNDRFYIQPNRLNTTPVTTEISEWRMSKGSNIKGWNYAPDDLIKNTDFVIKNDGFFLGSMEYNGQHIAQAILGKAGAIDLIADNVNLSNNLNVANQIKSLSLETVYANIANIRTRVLTANVVTADMLRADTALFEKLTGNTAFINSLFAKSATIGHIQAIDIDLNRATITGGDSTNYIRMTNQTIMSYGTFTRSWAGEKDTAKLELGLYDGQIRMRNLDSGYRLYFTERGLSTSMEGAIDQFTSGTLEFHSQRFNANSRGVTLHSSYGAVAMVSDFSTAYIRSNLTTNIESNLYSIYFRPYRQSRPGVNEFRLWVKDGVDASATDGVVSFGNADAGAASGIRFQKTTVGRPMIWATNGNGDIGSGNVRADSFIGDLEAVADFVYAVGQRMRVISNKNDKTSYADLQVRSLIIEHSYAFSNPGNQDVYFGVGGGEIRITNNNHWNNGNPSYRDIRLRTLRTMSSYAFENHSGGDTYFGVGGGKLMITDNNHYNGGNIGWRDIEFRNWKANSHEKYKKEISVWNLDVLDIFKNELQLYQYRYKEDLEENMLHRGIVLREDSTQDKFPSEWRQDDGYNGNEVLWWTVKGVQELAFENDELKSEIKSLKTRLATLEQRVA